MIRFLFSSLLTCVAAAIAVSPAYAQNTKPKPNFIVILADDLGYNDIGCFGSLAIRTPNIDKMASEGLKFTSFYVASPVCSPSRAALLTGCYPVRLGLGDELRNQELYGGKISRSFVKVIHSGSTVGLNTEEMIIPEVLKKAGYYSGMIGKWHLGDAPEFNPIRQGFDYYFGTPYSNDMKPFYFIEGTERLAGKPVDNELTTTFTHYARNFINAHKDDPFFLYIAHNMPHTPLTPGTEFEGKSARGLYGDTVEELDWSVGEILKALKDNGIDDRTLVVFTSDNGPWIMKGEHGGAANPYSNGKTTTYEGGMRVPCVMWGPGVLGKPGRVVNEIYSTMDFLPTFAAMAGLDYKPPMPIDGKNITPVLNGDNDSKSPWNHFFYYFGSELHAVRKGKWKYRTENILFNDNIYRRDEFSSAPLPATLYNLDWDPGEQKSVLKDHPEIESEMVELLEKAREEFGDTRTGRKGTGLRPAGKSFNPVNPKAKN